MRSPKAIALARKVSENLRSGNVMPIGKVMRNMGYSKSVSESPSRVVETKAFKDAFTLENRPLIDGIQKEINRIKEALAAKDLNNEEYRVLIGSIDVLTKNYQLLSGGATERQVFVLPSEVIERNNIDISVNDVPKLSDK